jgi:hypothetical protein
MMKEQETTWNKQTTIEFCFTPIIPTETNKQYVRNTVYLFACTCHLNMPEMKLRENFSSEHCWPNQFRKLTRTAINDNGDNNNNNSNNNKLLDVTFQWWCHRTNQPTNQPTNHKTQADRQQLPTSDKWLMPPTKFYFIYCTSTLRRDII